MSICVLEISFKRTQRRKFPLSEGNNVRMQKHAGITVALYVLTECQTLLVELLVSMVKDRITAEEVALLIHLFLDKTPPTVRLLTHPLRAG